MFINKIGYDHLQYGMNCQDYGLELDDFKLVCDGCSEGLHTEVGAKLFCYMMKYNINISEAFYKLAVMFGNTVDDMKNYLCFTTVYAYESIFSFILKYCGDGYVILEDIDGNITFEELTDGEYPKYYIYNYIDKKHLKHYAEGVSFTEKHYSKDKYKKIGVASDGLRYLFKLDAELQNEFIECLKTGKSAKVKRFINRNQNVFKDDLTIVF